jgi:hypothetical protein
MKELRIQRGFYRGKPGGQPSSKNKVVIPILIRRQPGQEPLDLPWAWQGVTSKSQDKLFAPLRRIRFTAIIR